MVKTLYKKDFQLWLKKTISHLEKQEFSELDIERLVEELIELGQSEKRTLESNLMILLAHLLKLKVQQEAPPSIKDSWYRSVIEHRQRVKKNLRDTPSLKSYLETAIEEAYPDARKIAINQGKLAQFGVPIPAENEYPTNCPFLKKQILDENLYRNWPERIILISTLLPPLTPSLSCSSFKLAFEGAEIRNQKSEVKAYSLDLSIS